MADVGPTNPGAGGIFETLGTLFERNYKVVVRPPKVAATQPASAPAFSDPRGILPAGLVPASQLSYQILDECQELVVVNNFEARGGGVSLGFAQIIGQITVNSKTTFAVICFEGKDVIDLPTTDLKFENGGVVVPDKVFLPLYAGDKFIGPDDSLAEKASLEFIKKSAGNAVKSVVPVADAPFDSRSNPTNIFGDNSRINLVDVASNTIELNGGASFISYVACDKPLFRDVITMNSSAIAQGLFIGNDFIISFAGPFGDPILTVLRYQFINFETNPTLPPRFQWRLSESFGFKVDKAETTPSTLTLTGAEKTTDILDAAGLHFAYNLNDVGPDTDEKYPNKPIKQAYSPALATAKMNQESPFFDKNFKAQILPFAKNQFFFQSRLEIKRIFGLSPLKGSGLNRLVQTRSYVSPAHIIPLGSKARFGVEYVRHQFSHSTVFGQDDAIFLASTKPSAEGIGVYYDPCIKALVVILIENGTVVQRLFNDKTWAISNIKVPEGKLKAFLIGETTEQSAGPTAIMPFSKDLNIPIGGTTGEISVPDDSVATAFELNPPTKGDPPAILELFTESDTTGTPACEIRIPAGAAMISIPATPFKSFNISNPNGASIKKVLGAKKAFLDQMEAPAALANPTQLDALVAFQLSQNKADEFPMKASATSTAGLSIFGSAFVAYESLGRIDMAYRPSISVPFVVVRDVCFRVSENLTPADLGGDAGQSTFPSANMPFLLPVPQTSSIMLFYEYKDRILMKSIPSVVFSEVDTVVKESKFDAKVEASLSSTLMKLIPVVVYDGNIADSKEGLQGDLAFGTVSVIPNPPSATAAKNTDKPKIIQHSACMTKGGYVYSFIQDNSTIRVRRSSNSGKNWEDVFPEGTVFLPESKAGTESSEDSPSCFYDLSNRKVLLFFVVDSALLMMSIPDDLLFLPMESAASQLKKIIPTVVYGSVSDNLKERGIQAQSTVLERQKANSAFSETITPHRVSIGRLDGGQLRLFFIDELKKLKTLISTDSGNTWQTEDQFIKSR